MRIIISVKCRGPKTQLAIKPEYGAKDNVRERNRGAVITETIQAMLSGCARDPDAHGLLVVETANNAEFVQKVVNSNNRILCDQVIGFIRSILDRLPHVITRVDKENIRRNAERCIRRLSI